MRVFKYTKMMVSGWVFTEYLDLSKVYMVTRFDDAGGLNHVYIKVIGEEHVISFTRAEGQAEIALDFIKQIEEFWNDRSIEVSNQPRGD